MADPVATVEKIVKIGLKIKDAVDTVRHNEEDCNEIRRRVLRFSAILSQLQQTGMMNDSPAMSGALEDLEETLERALELVEACQETGTIRRLVKAGELSKKLRRVKDDILNKVMLASFAIHAHTTVVLLTIQAGGHPLPLQPEDERVAGISHNSHSAEDPRSEINGGENIAVTGSDPSSTPPSVALKKFSLSELKDAIKSGDLIGKGGFGNVYKSVLNNGNVVAIKISNHPQLLSFSPTYDEQLLLVPKLQHKNIVKVLGYGCEVGSSSVITRLLKRIKDQAQARECFYWVQEYIPNGSLRMIIDRELPLDWASLSRIIEGVAQGIHYLHEQHIVHRDLKPDNILLDSNMNPKISDFDLCIVLNDGEDTDESVAGTVGYIAPEYLAEGILSLKNDVHGFGVILLDIVGSMYRSKPPFYITDNNIKSKPGVKEAWSAWEAGRIEELFDPLLFDGSQLLEIKRSTHVGLLCTQLDRADRPAMADILEMLHGAKELSTPKRPAYIVESSRRRNS